jgi:hypothetical protein
MQHKPVSSGNAVAKFWILFSFVPVLKALKKDILP